MTAWMVIQAIFILLLPICIICLCKNVKLLKFLGPVLLCYVLGLILGNLPLPLHKNIASSISEITIVLAIPFILFNCDIVRWFSTSNKTVLSFSLLTISVIIAATIAVLLFSAKMHESWNVSGMLIGCYTGGTPNLVAIGLGLAVNKDVIAMVVASDTIIGGIYYFLLLAFGIRLAGKFLEPFDKTENRLVQSINSESNKQISEPTSEISMIHSKNDGISIVRVSLLAIFSAGASIGLAILFTGEMSVAFIMLGVTTFGIVFSLFKKINSTKQSYYIGQYLIYVFSFSLALTIDITSLMSMPGIYFVYTAFVMFGAVLIHFVLARIFKIDTDTAIVTSTAGIYGPAFVPSVVSALKNDDVMITGLSCGLIGYAIGNYLGFLMANIAKLLVT